MAKVLEMKEKTLRVKVSKDCCGNIDVDVFTDKGTEVASLSLMEYGPKNVQILVHRATGGVMVPEATLGKGKFWMSEWSKDYYTNFEPKK